MRTLANIAVLLAAVAGILSLSVALSMREQRRLLADFSASNREEVAAAVAALSARLGALEQDTSVLTDLVERSMAAHERDAETQRRVWESAFVALAKVVPQYRSIALYRDDGALQVSGLDPTEDLSTGSALLGRSRSLALAVTRAGAAALEQPAYRRAERSFFLYGAPVRGSGAIVVASDVAILLAAVKPTHAVGVRVFVTNPAGLIWQGCGSASGCRAALPGSLPDVIWRAGNEAAVDPDTADALGLGRSPAVRISQVVSRPTGSWTVTAVASYQAILSRERQLLSRLVATGLAAAVAVVLVGLLILRQQRHAVTLAGRLQYAQALASARQTSEAIVENAPLGVLGLSPDGRVAVANRFLTDRVGPIELGVSLDRAVPDEAAAWLRELRPALLERAGSSAVRLLSTSAPPFDVRIVPVHNPALGVQTFALFEDRSLIRDLENQLVRAEKLITVGVLSAGIAHEIGSPLAVIRGRAEQVLRHLGDHARAEDLRTIIKHIDHISSTIRQVLDFSRRQPIERRPAPLETAVRRSGELLQWKLTPKRISVDVDLDQDLPELSADPAQLEQVLVNLLINACDASQPGGRLQVVARRAGVSPTSGERLISVAVIDEGCGIAPDHLHAVFDPFFTTKKGGEGTGLGLTIVASIVRNHGGEINLSSAPGKGTAAVVLWPAVREQA